MFIADKLVFDVGFPAAQARLANLARPGGLSSASKAAHADELSAVIRVSPFDDAAGASKLVRVRYRNPVCRGDVMTLARRWEATGVTGALFPVLDADITLTRPLIMNPTADGWRGRRPGPALLPPAGPIEAGYHESARGPRSSRSGHRLSRICPQVRRLGGKLRPEPVADRAVRTGPRRGPAVRATARPAPRDDPGRRLRHGPPVRPARIGL